MHFLLILDCVFCVLLLNDCFIFPNTYVLSMLNCRSNCSQNKAPVTCSYNDTYDFFFFLHEQRNFAEQLINNNLSLMHLYWGLSLNHKRLQYAANFLAFTIDLHKGDSNPATDLFRLK
jgi:hypothetical protein